MKILQVTTGFPPDRVGGIENWMYLVYRELSRRGHEVKILTRFWRMHVKDKNVIQIKTPSGEITGYTTWAVKGHLRALLMRSDIIHCHGFEGHIICSLPHLNQPTILHIRNTLSMEPGHYSFWRHRLGLKIQKRACRKATKIIAPTTPVKKDILKHVKNIDERKIEVIPHFTDVEKFSPWVNTQIIRKSYGLEKKIVILYFGKIKATKGLEEICKAFRIVRDKREDASLMLVGGPTATMRFYNSLRFNYPEVIFTGYIPHRDASKYYAAADIYCIYTSGFAGGETFAITLAEAMAMGLPIVCSDNPIFREVTRGNAVFAQPNNPQKLAEALLYLIDNPKVRRAMGRKSREIAKKFYDYRKVVSQIEKLYKAIS